jgi:hypothetical protein
MRAVRVGTATFDPVAGTGSLTADGAELATGWTYAQLAERAATTTFAATFDVSWEAVCVADDTSASSTSAGRGKVRRGVLQSVSHDTSSGALTGFDLHGYSGVLDRFDVPAPGDRCRVSIDPFPAGQISKVAQTARRVWLSMADGYEIGGYAL